MIIHIVTAGDTRQHLTGLATSEGFLATAASIYSNTKMANLFSDLLRGRVNLRFPVTRSRWSLMR